MARRSAASDVSDIERFILYTALERIASKFESNERTAPFRIPSSPFSLDQAIDLFADDEEVPVDPREVWNAEPGDLVLSLQWDSFPGFSSTWGLWGLTLPSRRRVYINSSEHEGTNVLAATGPTFTPAAEDVRVLQLLAMDNGAALGTGVIGTIPDEIRIGPKLPKEQLITLVADLLAHSDNDLRERVGCSERTSDRGVVEQWLRDLGVFARP